MSETPHIVSDVMTRTVVAVGRDAPFKEMVQTLRQWRVSAMPVLEGEGRVIGVVSEADLLPKEELRDSDPGRFEQLRRLPDLAKARAVTAEELMSSPAVSVHTDATLAEAARIMAVRGVKRLPVVDAEGMLLGIVSRADLLKVFLRPDEDIEEEVRRTVVAYLFPGDSGIHVGVERELARSAGSSAHHRPFSAAARRRPGRVLVVDDEPDLTEVLSGALRYEGWEVRTAADGASALDAVRAFHPDAVVLDWMLPDTDGLAVLRAVRSELPDVCVLFLTARDAVEDRIAGITAGGDDYVTKPFSLEEVLARLRGLLRRAGMAREPGDDRLVVADLVMDEQAREVTRGGVAVELSRTEFELLRFLMRNPRRVLSKAQILDRVWSYDFGGQAHVVELYISYLRKKIDAGRAPLIHTVRGVGYVLKAEVS
ncbi:Sensor histidine kinase RcsC [Streptomyces antimycoticus]